MEIPTSRVYVGKGVVSIAALDSSLTQTGPFIPIGNCPSVTITQEVSKASHRESMSGINVMDAEWVTGVDVKASIVCDNFDADGYRLASTGTKTPVVAGAAVTGQTLTGSTTLTIGSRYHLGAMNVTAVTVKDSTGSPVTLAAGTDYTLDAESGVITLLKIVGFVGPLKADYTPGAYTEIEGMTSIAENYAVMIQGINQVDEKKEIFLLGNVRIPPADQIGVISEDVVSYTLECGVMKDKNGAFYKVLVA